MANPTQALYDTHQFNIYIAKALLPLTPRRDRPILEQWIKKLNLICDPSNIETLALQNNYLWFLLMVMQKGKIVAPFNATPPDDCLPPLARYVRKLSMEEVLQTLGENVSSMSDPHETSTLLKLADGRACRPAPITPAAFLKSMPVPYKGIICYGAVFCDESLLCDAED